MNNNLQRTAEWYSDRLYMFTSSELHKLLSEPREKKAKETGELSKSAKTYIYDKLAETLTAGTCLDYKNFTTKETLWGIDHEPTAIFIYEEKTGVKVEGCGFIKFNDYFGGSPDGLVNDDGIIEVKCPYNSSNHIENLLINSQEEFKEIRGEYYAQIQGNLINTKRQWCDFISYDPRCQSPLFQIKILRIIRDVEFIDKVLSKLEKAHMYRESLKTNLIKLA